MVRRKLVDTRTEAKRAIEAGLVRVGTNTAPKPATMVAPDESVHLVARPEPFVSRAGRKLEGALDAFEIDVAGIRWALWRPALSAWLQPAVLRWRRW